MTGYGGLMRLDPAAQDVLDFWFGAPGSPEHGREREAWFLKDAVFDRAIATRFGALIDSAIAGALAHWQSEPLGALAEIVVLDQFTRNVFRDTPRAFSGDARALRAAQALVESGTDRGLLAVQRQFVYLPFEHAESAALQDQAMRLFEQLAADHPEQAGLIEWADKHRVIIERFGRFPHRNLVLGRVSTAEEIEFLQQPGSGF
jgi:uncharacterized protein (DUF924 family)